MKSTICAMRALVSCSLLLLSNLPVQANIPGGGAGTGANVTVTDNGNGTVTMANGVVSIVVTKSGAVVNQINYTYDNGGGAQTRNLLAGGKNGGELYWEFGGWGGSSWAYSLVTNTGSYAEIDLLNTSANNGVVDIHFSMLRGSPGFYATPIFSHRAQDPAMGTGEERDNIYIAPYFNWMSVNDQVQRETGIDASYTGAFYSPVEDSLCTSGPLQGTYDDKYKWSADFSAERVWGWSSVSDSAFGVTGENVGIWHVVSSWEFYNGGPMKPDLNDAPMVNMINGGHYYFGNDSGFTAGEVWTRVSGPYFIYVNNVSGSLTDPVQTSQALWADAKAQAAAEATAWPYGWMNNPNYASAAQRGTVTGQIVINDAYDPNASASNLWVGVEQQPAFTGNNAYDFQLWSKPYEFWTKTDANGNFVISNVIAGNNYTLYAFGPGASGMFMSKNQNGGNPGITYALPSSPFTVVVTGGATSSLGTVTWTPTRVGPTVFQIGYQTRKGDKFRHGDDYWVGDVGPSPTAPSPVWTKFLDFPFDFPNGLNYIVGQNRWNTDWNFVQSVYPDSSGNNTVSSSTVTFNLASAPAAGATASVLMGIASDDDSPIYVTVNGTLLSGGNATGTPNTSLPTSGWYPNNDISDSNIREENHGGYSDERLTFAGSLLQAGNNTINFSFRQAGGSDFTHHFMYDYVRLELTGYVPPAPAGVSAYPASNAVQLSWPTVAGATSYNLLRSTTSGSGYTTIASGVTGPMCGSGPANAVYLDNTVANGTTYYYVIQSVNPVGASGNSPECAGVTPSSGIATSVPATPAGLVAGLDNSVVTLTWNAVPGANFYTVYRGTVVNKIGYVPFYIILSNTTTNNTYTDASGTLGCTYCYYVTATSAAGTSGASTAVTAKPVPPPPANAPAFTVSNSQTSSNQANVISWPPVNGAVGYLLYRATSASGPFSFPANFIQSMATTSYHDNGLPLGTTYYYMVVAMNAGGVAGNLGAPPPSPGGLAATAGNNQVALSWGTSSGATSYNLKRSTVSGGPYITIASPSTTSYTDATAANGTTYYYVVSAVSAGGESANSGQVAATPRVPAPPTPTGLAVTAGNNQAALTWNASSGATSYNVGRSTTSGGGYVTIASPATPNYTDTTAANGTTYYYVVSAVNGGGTSASSSQVTATPEPPVPPTPTGLTATAGNAQVALTWNASSGATSYNVGRSTTSGGGYATIASPATANYTDTTAANGTTYYYVVSAVNGGGTSANSSQVIATPEPSIPSTPTGLAATAGNNQVALTWNASSGATSYNVGRSITSGGGYATIASPATANFTDTTAANGTTYYYVVAAVNGGGTSPNSSQVVATPVSAATTNQLLVNPGFELPGTGKITTGYATVTGWANSGVTYTDTGVQTNPPPHSGLYSAYCKGGDSGAYQIANYQMNPGDTITLTWWAEHSGGAATSTQAVSLVSAATLNAAFSATTTLASNNAALNGYGSTAGPWAQYTLSYQATAADAGRYVGVYFNNATPANWDGFDDFSLTAAPLLPSPWATADIGAVGLAGSATDINGLFVVTGSGVDTWNTGDSFRYVYQPASGDCSIQARLLTLQNTQSHAKGGVMIRETLNTNSTMALVDLTPSVGAEFIWRTNTGASAASAGVAGLTAPNWVKITRTGNSFVGYYSTDGTDWTSMATNTLPMAANIYIGLAVCSHLNTSACTATFTNVLPVP
jgi:fibronectin type 3 domain-containing protein/regulation of enolase protein 1 (concanavalin A-like superfamily)